MKKIIVPLLASAVALAAFQAPVQAGSWQDRQDRLIESEEFQSFGKDKRAKRADKRMSKRNGLSKREARRARAKDRRMGRKARRSNGGGGYAATGGGGHMNQALAGYDIPDYLGGYDQPAHNRGTFQQVLEPYNLPDLSAGLNRGPEGRSGGMAEALEPYDLPDLNPYD